MLTHHHLTGFLLGLSACAPQPEPTQRQGAAETAPIQDTAAGSPPHSPTDEPTATSSTSPATPDGPCPVDMVLIDDRFCIDAYEAALEERSESGDWQSRSPYLTVDGATVRAVPARGIPPQGYISGNEAGSACEANGKRLCTSEEWLAACQGPTSDTYPYGDTYIAGACNDAYAGSHPVVDYFGTSSGIWDTDHMNDPGINQQPGTLAAGGEHSDCLSAGGAYDLHGNLHEWVADGDGVFRGGFYADAAINGAGCLYTTTAHAIGYHDYSTGFRCCQDAP